MRTLILVIVGVLSGYIISNLETKKLEEILEDMLTKVDNWLEIIQKFIGETINGIEGMDSDVIKINIDGFIDGLKESVDKFLDFETFEERIDFIEKRITEISTNLLKKASKIEG